MPPGCLLGEFLCPTGRKPQGRPRICWRDYVFGLAYKHLCSPLEELLEEEVVGASPLRLLLG